MRAQPMTSVYYHGNSKSGTHLMALKWKTWQQFYNSATDKSWRKTESVGDRDLAKARGTSCHPRYYKRNTRVIRAVCISRRIHHRKMKNRMGRPKTYQKGSISLSEMPDKRRQASNGRAGSGHSEAGILVWRVRPANRRSRDWYELMAVSWASQMASLYFSNVSYIN